MRDDDLVRDQERWLYRTRKTSSEVGSGGSFGHVEKLRCVWSQDVPGNGPTALEELGASRGENGDFGTVPYMRVRTGFGGAATPVDST
jgi:hypothetical protein